MPPLQDFLLFAAQAICHLGFRVAQCFPGAGGATHPLPTATQFLASSSSSAHPSSYSMGMPVSQGLNLLVGVPHANLYGSPRQPWGPSTVGPGHPQGRKALRPHPWSSGAVLGELGLRLRTSPAQSTEQACFLKVNPRIWGPHQLIPSQSIVAGRQESSRLQDC